MPFNVFVATSSGAPRDHHSIFVETKADESGFVFQVTGNIQQGMTHEFKPSNKPEDSVSFVGKTFIGTVTEEKYAQMEAICRGIPPPPKQFDGPKRIKPNEPLRRCQEWNAEAVQALKDAGVIVAA